MAIGRLERFVGDWELRDADLPAHAAAGDRQEGGRGGLGPGRPDLRRRPGRKGHKVTIFESLHAPGGVLIYGIPEFRLPKSVINAEIEFAVECLGIEHPHRPHHRPHLHPRRAAGRVRRRLPGHRARACPPSCASRASTERRHVGQRVPDPGQPDEGLLFPEYDTPVKVGQHVAVVGAGNVAMDSPAAACACRRQCAKRNGDEPARCISSTAGRAAKCRRAHEEVHHAEEEGIIFDFLTNPVEILGDEKGNVRAHALHPHGAGRARRLGPPQPGADPGSEFEMPMDTVIMALGTSPNPIVFNDAEDLQRSRTAPLCRTARTGRTTMERVWAGGDVVTGAATVISAMGAGKRAAADINAFLASGKDGVGDPS